VPDPKLVTALGDPPPSLARTREADRAPLRLGLVQERWREDPDEHVAALGRGIAMAAEQGAQVVCLQELTLSPYFAITPDGPAAAGAEPEELPGGPTFAFASEAARANGVHVHASLFERPEPGDDRDDDGPGLQHRDPRRARRHARRSHAQAAHPGHRGLLRGQVLPARPAGDDGFPVVPVGEAKFGFPTCWDQWFPELARAYSIAGAEVIVYPTAIGSEPDHPDFDTEPLWEQVIVANGIQNGTFMVAVNRIGTEEPLTFYGSSFISDPYGRKLVQAPRDEAAVLVADLDLDQRRDWLELFPFLRTRRPDAYASLLETIKDELT
jgi:N-carbamoylputrescine amidase